MDQKPPEFWIALFFAALYVYQRGSDKPLASRVTVTAISAALGYTLTPDVVALTGRGEMLTLVVLVTMVFVILDFVSSLFSDRKAIVEIIRGILKK